MWWSLVSGCEPMPLPLPSVTLSVTLSAALEPSPFVPAAAEVRWDGPAGHATLWVDDGTAWRPWVEAPVADGPSVLPLTLLPVGQAWGWQVTVDDDEGQRWSSAPAEVTFEAPEGVAIHGVHATAEAGFASGWWVGNQYGGRDAPSVAVVLDADGEVVWWAPPPDGGHTVIRARPSLDGRSVLTLEDHRDPALRRIVRLSLDGRRRTETAAPDANHDFRELPDGRFSFLAYVLSDTLGMPGLPLPTAADTVRTVSEASDAAPADGFDFFEDYPWPPWVPCPHAGFDRFVPDASEWTHANSLIRAPGDDGWLIVARYIDALVMARDDGSLAWQAGGLHATVTPQDGATFRHGHASDAWLEGDDLHLLMFDNRSHDPEPVVSRVVELALTPEGVMREVWSMEDPAGRYTMFLGDAQRLPNGDTLVTWTGGGPQGGVLAEYTPSGDEVWRAEAEAPLGRGTWVPTLRP